MDNSASHTWVCCIRRDVLGYFCTWTTKWQPSSLAQSVTFTLRWLGSYDLLYLAVFRSNTKLHAKLWPNPPTIIATLRDCCTLLVVTLHPLSSRSTGVYYLKLWKHCGSIQLKFISVYSSISIGVDLWLIICLPCQLYTAFIVSLIISGLFWLSPLWVILSAALNPTLSMRLICTCTSITMWRLTSVYCIPFNKCIQQMALFNKTSNTPVMQVLIEFIQWCTENGSWYFSRPYLAVCMWCNHVMMHTSKLVIIHIIVFYHFVVPLTYIKLVLVKNLRNKESF